MGATESKLAFRKNVLQLFEVRNISKDNVEYWNAFIELPESAEDVFNLFSPKDLRKVRDLAPENLQTLLQTVIQRILSFVSAAARPDSSTSIHILNCVRILTRIIPYIFEQDATEFENSLFWTAQSGVSDFIGTRLVKAVVALLFYKGFSLPIIATESEGVHYVIWHKGVGATNAPAATREVDAVRTETLRLLLTLMSRTIYVAPTAVVRYSNRWIEVLATSLEKKAVLSLLCSLMNTALHYDPVGWGLVPYNHVLFSDTQEQLVTISLHVLIALLDYSPSSDLKRGSISTTPVTEVAAPKSEVPAENLVKESPVGSNDSLESSKENLPSGQNSFRYFLSKLYRTQDFIVIMDGVARLLKNPMDSANTYLPGSTKSVTVHVEVVMFFWKMSEINEARNSSVGLARMCCFLLHSLSQERNFGIQLNTPFEASAHSIITRHLPIFSSGTYADFLFLSIHTFITTTSSKFSPLVSLHETYLIALANVSPYVKSLTVVTTNKILGMWSVFVSGAWLCANETNHKLIFYLLDAFNNLVQYQMTGNTPLIYAIVRNKEKFYDLRDLTFQKAQKEIQALKTRKAQRAAAAAGLPPPTTTEEKDDELSERKKGKMPENPVTEESPRNVTPTVDPSGKFIATEEW
ncbi:hypothetical protein HK096_005475, partial [Nowakowskiella sp. JEL0078]